MERVLFILIPVIYLVILFIFFSLLHRLVKAQEQSSRHLLEIVRDLKKLTDKKKE